MKFFDDKNKKLTWWTRNYFYLGTILFISTCILIYAFCGNATPDVATNEHVWNELCFSNLFQAFLNNVFHSNWQHVLLNMFAFSTCGLYVERKTGTFNFILLTLAVIIFDAAFTAGNNLSVAWIGASGVQYCFYGYIIIDYIFSFQKAKRNKTNTILGGVILGVIYISMCFNGGTSSFGFEIYPHDLLTNLGHYSPFFAGLLIGLIVQIAQKKVLAAATVNYINDVDEKHNKIYKIVNICALVLIGCLIGLTSTCSVIASTRTRYSVNIYCDNEDYNGSYNYNINDSYSNLSFSSIYYNWANNIKLDQKSEYVCEIFTDANKTIHMDNFRKNGNCNYLTLSRQFVALSRPTNFNFYITISKAFKVQNNVNYCVYKLYEENSIAEDNAKIHNLDYSTTNKVKAGDTYKFKVELYRNYDINKLKVYNNGVELNLDSNGYYVVENVADDLLITYEYIS